MSKYWFFNICRLTNFWLKFDYWSCCRYLFLKIKWLSCLRLNCYWNRSMSIYVLWFSYLRYLNRSWNRRFYWSSNWNYRGFNGSTNINRSDFSLNFNRSWSFCSSDFNRSCWLYRPIFTSDRSFNSDLPLWFNSHLSLRSFNSNFSSDLRFNSNFSSDGFRSNLSDWFRSDLSSHNRSWYSLLSLNRCRYSDISLNRSILNSDWRYSRRNKPLSIISTFNSLRSRSDHDRTGNFNFRSGLNRSCIFNNNFLRYDSLLFNRSSSSVSSLLILHSGIISIWNSSRLINSWSFRLLINNLNNFTIIEITLLMILNPISDMTDSSMICNTVKRIRYNTIIILFNILNKFISSLSKCYFLMITNIPRNTRIFSTWLLINFSLKYIKKLSYHLRFAYSTSYQSITIVLITHPYLYFSLFIYSYLLFINIKETYMIS